MSPNYISFWPIFFLLFWVLVYIILYYICILCVFVCILLSFTIFLRRIGWKRIKGDKTREEKKDHGRTMAEFGACHRGRPKFLITLKTHCSVLPQIPDHNNASSESKMPSIRASAAGVDLRNVGDTTPSWGDHQTSSDGAVRRVTWRVCAGCSRVCVRSRYGVVSWLHS